LPLLVLAGLAVGAGCTCADTAAQQRFACTTGADCADGYSCDPTGECVASDGGPGGGPGGGGGGAAGGAGGGGMGGGGGGGTVDAGGLQLVITSVPQTVSVGSCSAPITFEVREGPTPLGVPVSTPVSISAAPSGVLGLFAGPGCTDAGRLVLEPDAGSGSFSFFAGDGGGFLLSLSAPGLAGASQQATTTYPPTASLVFVTPTQTVRAGDCSAALTLELRDSSNAPAKANAPLAVGLSATPAAPGMLFFSDPACLLAISQSTVPFGASRTTFYAARDTGAAYLLNATAGTLSATQSHVVLPVVRTGTCLISGGDGGTTCLVTPPVLTLSDSFLVYQVATATDIAGAAAVRCELDGLANISCQRGRTAPPHSAARSCSPPTRTTGRRSTTATSTSAGSTTPAPRSTSSSAAAAAGPSRCSPRW
ncbi:MAG: hypothetical protein H6Q89_4744, partial [Myxococcaceae bacterium]|nr:hypothetical protein [Myxococcaceae bacterium]